MGELLDLAFYNPTRLSDDDFLRGFMARRELVEKILARLADVRPRGVAQHRLVIGQRGMGKTSLLRRIAIGVRDDPALSAVLLPMSFREEQYNVHNLHVFWCNCLDALGDWFEAAGRHEQAEQVDRDVATLEAHSDDVEGEAALEVFRKWMKQEGKRPLLLLDNIDLIFGGLKKQQWSLRRVLQEAGGIVVIGASAVYLEATVDPKAAFFDFFQVDVLEKLTHPELLSCLRGLAAARGEAGQRVSRVLNQDPARISTLYDLTGGNPRTLVMLYLMLEMNDDGDLMRDLERLLDQATPLYKARVEDLALQTRVVFDAVALAWNPVIAADVAEATGLKVSAVSTQLDRLGQDGILEKVSLSRSRRTGFQVAERFFNIWYLMRHAPRRQRNRLRWLTEFLRGFYTPRQLSEVADEYMRRPSAEGHSAALIGLAVADAVDSAAQRRALSHHVTRLLKRHCREARKRLADIIDLDDLHAPSLAMAELEERTLRCPRDWGDIDPKEFWDRLGGSVVMPREAKALVVEQLPELDIGKLRFIHGFIEKEEQGLQRLWDHSTGWEGLRRAISEGLMNSPGDFHGALAAAVMYGIPAIVVIAHGFAGGSFLLDPGLDTEELGRQIDLLLVMGDTERTVGGAHFWYGIGNLLMMNSNRYEEAEAAFRKASKLDPGLPYLWNELGNLLADNLGRAEDAEQAYRRSLEIEPSATIPLANLAYLLLPRGDCTEEAKDCYQRAIAALPASGAGVLKAYSALVRDDFGIATQELGAVLEKGDTTLFSSFYDDLMRLLRLARERGYGDRLLAWLDETGLSDRYWPLRAAFDAYLHGEARLQDVNPEVRGAARRMYNWLTSRPGGAGR